MVRAMTSGPTPRMSRGASGAALALPVLVAWVLFIGGGFAGIYDVRVRAASLALVTLAFSIWIVLAIRDAQWRPRSTLSPALAAGLLGIAVAEATSREPRLGIEYLAWAVVLTGLYLLLVRISAHPELGARLARTVVIGGAVLSVGYLVVVASNWLELWRLVGSAGVIVLRPAGASLTLGNPSAVMTVAVLLLAPSIAHLRSSGAATWTIGLMTVLVGAVIVTSGSRSGWVAIVVAAAVTGLAAILLRPRPDRVANHHRIARRSRWQMGGVAGFLALAAIGAIALGPAVLGRLDLGGLPLRVVHWSVAVRMGADALPFGVGPGGWAAERIRYTIPPESDYYIPHAHDLYLQTTAELGIVGVAAGLVAVVVLTRFIFRRLRDPDARRRAYAWAALFSTVYFAAHHVLDFYANMPAALFAFALPLARLDAGARPVPRTDGSPETGAARRLALGACLLAATVAIAVLVMAETTAALQQRAVDAFAAGRFEAALADARRLVGDDPEMPTTHLVHGLAAGALGRYEEAAAAFARSAAADDLPAAWLDLAAIQAAQGRPSEAGASLQRALRLGDQQPALLVGAAAVRSTLGQSTAAESLLVRAFIDVPSLAGDLNGPTDPHLGMIWGAALQRAATRSRDVAFEMLLAIDPAAARRSTDAWPDPDAARLARLVAGAWAGDRAAFEALLADARREPLTSERVAWTARVAAHLGDEPLAAELRRWTDLAGGGLGAGGYEVRLAATWPLRAPIAGLTGTYHGQYAYRRPTPWDQLVPGLPHLVYVTPQPDAGR